MTLFLTVFVPYWGDIFFNIMWLLKGRRNWPRILVGSLEFMKWDLKSLRVRWSGAELPPF